MKYAFLKTYRLPLAAAFAFAAFSAQAADLYAPGFGAKDSPYAVPSWTGFYLGVNGGYGWGESSTLNTSAYLDALDGDGNPGAGTSTYGSSSLTPEGGFGGGQLGYNLQRDRVVFGVEADIQGASITGSTFSEANNSDGTVVTDAWAKSTLDWVGTVRGRVGYSFGGYLLYATGGLAFGGVKDSLSWSVTSQSPDTPATVNGSASSNTTLTGYVIGAGFETAITPSWSVKAEYQYIDLGSTTLSGNSGSIPWTCAEETTCNDSGGASTKINHTYDTVRLGLNYKINQSYDPLK